jgi:hypothetical protein
MDTWLEVEDVAAAARGRPLFLRPVHKAMLVVLEMATNMQKAVVEALAEQEAMP